MDQKVRLIAAPLSEDSCEWIKGVVMDPSLRDPRDIGHWFTDETIRRLKIGGGGFLLPPEKKKFWAMLKSHGKAFAFALDDRNQW